MAEPAPQFYTDPAQWAEQVAGQYTVHIHSFNALDRLVISDVDDTLIDSNRAWHEDYVRMALGKGIDPAELADLEAFARCTPRVCFTELDLVEDYSAYKAEQMHDIIFHAGMTALDDAARVLPNFVNLNLPGAYLSTRPAKPLGDITKHQLNGMGFPPAPVLLRPEEIPYERTIEFKVMASLILRQAMDDACFTDMVVEYVDDYIGAVNAINILGRDGLVGTLYDSTNNSWVNITQRILQGRRPGDLQDG